MKSKQFLFCVSVIHTRSFQHTPSVANWWHLKRQTERLREEMPYMPYRLWPSWLDVATTPASTRCDAWRVVGEVWRQKCFHDTDAVPSSHFQVMFISLNVKFDMSCVSMLTSSPWWSAEGDILYPVVWGLITSKNSLKKTGVERIDSPEAIDRLKKKFGSLLAPEIFSLKPCMWKLQGITYQPNILPGTPKKACSKLPCIQKLELENQKQMNCAICLIYKTFFVAHLP